MTRVRHQVKVRKLFELYNCAYLETHGSVFEVLNISLLWAMRQLAT